MGGYSPMLVFSCARMFVAAVEYPPTSHLNHKLFNTDISMGDN